MPFVVAAGAGCLQRWSVNQWALNNGGRDGRLACGRVNSAHGCVAMGQCHGAGGVTTGDGNMT
jgi:hypothetical protein